MINNITSISISSDEVASMSFSDDEVTSMSFSEKGTAIEEEKGTTSLELVNENPHFKAAAKLIHNNQLTPAEKIGKKFSYSADFKDTQGHQLLLNVNTAASSLYLTKKQLEQAAKEGNFNDLASQTKIISFIFRKAKKIDSKESEKIIKNIKLVNTENKTVQFKLSGKTYWISKNEKGSVDLFQIKKKLGEGSNGKIKAILDIVSTSEKLVTKIALKRKGKKAINDLEKEYRLLKKIYENGRELDRVDENGKLLGIQAEAKQILQISSNDRDIIKKHAIITKRYDTDYLEYVPQKTEFIKKLSEFYQLLCGLDFIHDLDIINGDIKAENILVEIVSKDMTRVDISDFGGAKDASNKNDFKPKPTGTIKYMTSEDLDEFTRLVNDPKCYDELIELEKKRDVFAMGTVLYGALTNGEFPYVIKRKYNSLCGGEFDFPDLKKYREIQGNNIPEKIKDLIEAMLNPDYKKRFSAKEAFRTINGYIDQLRTQNLKTYQEFKKGLPK